MSSPVSISNRIAEQSVEIKGPAGVLQARVAEVESRDAIAVVCHPHPLFGGTMDNKVVVTLTRSLQEARVATVRFNFRGVGSSAGGYDEGVGELQDAHAVVVWARERWPNSPLVSAGFSFGANIALRLALETSAVNLITIAPPVARFRMHELAAPECPWLIVQGDDDEVVSASEVVDWSAAFRPQPQLERLSGAGHFFHGKLTMLKDIVIAQTRRVLAARAPA